MAASSPPPMLPSPFVQSGLSLHQLTAILWARRRQVLTMVLLAALAAGVVSKLLPRQYDATAALLVDFEVNDPLTGREFPSMLANTYMATQVELIGSVRTLQPVVRQLELTRDDTFTAGYSGPDSAAALEHYAVDRLWQRLSISQGQDSRFIYIGARAPDAERAAQIANAVAESYLAQYRLLAAQPAQARAARYREQLAQLRAEVDAAQQRLTEFRSRTGLINSAGTLGVDEERLLQLGSQLVDIQARRREAEQRAARGSELDPGALGSSLVQSMKSQLGQVEARLAELTVTRGPRHPEVRALHEQQAALQQRLDAETGRYGRDSRAQADDLRRQEDQLQRALDAQRERITALRRQQDEAARYQRDLDSAKQVYDRALSSYDQVLFDAGSDHSSVTIAAHATPPSRHSSPKARKNVALGLGVGAVLGVLGALAAELLARRIRCRQDLEIDLGLPVLAELELASTPAQTRAPRWLGRWL